MSYFESSGFATFTSEENSRVRRSFVNDKSVLIVGVKAFFPFWSNPSSIFICEEHPSPLKVFPSSHSSGEVIRPSPGLASQTPSLEFEKPEIREQLMQSLA